MPKPNQKSTRTDLFLWASLSNSKFAELSPRVLTLLQSIFRPVVCWRILGVYQSSDFWHHQPTTALQSQPFWKLEQKCIMLVAVSPEQSDDKLTLFRSLLGETIANKSRFSFVSGFQAQNMPPSYCWEIWHEMLIISVFWIKIKIRLSILGEKAQVDKLITPLRRVGY